MAGKVAETQRYRTLGLPFETWLIRLRRRDISPATRGAYAADMAALGACMLQALGREAPPPLRDRQRLATLIEDDNTLLPIKESGIPLPAYVKARVALDNVRPEEITVSMVEETLALHATDRSPASRARARITLNQFFRHLIRNGTLHANPLDQIERDRPRRRLPKPLEPDAVRRLVATIAQPDPRTRRPWPGRDLALAAVLSATGIRLSEALTANVNSIVGLDGEAPLLRVRGKGSKDRVV